MSVTDALTERPSFPDCTERGSAFAAHPTSASHVDTDTAITG